ncbi:lytic transglycosylase domain-containing protein [Pseudomonas sp. PB120]|uniref:lytic transglycosylase domain-containing protein n=1 Tax=Pseudomonas sp. PB120 TaxID=2494700 RepID=UPI0012FE576F|nr:lytic transglycosylase domain-containing protein [Pseudomonas sp. PB120]MVV47022.1 lytic transglycosylase domain-containing protein [Pseudomonas sp. PB120]
MSSKARRWARNSFLGGIELALLIVPLCASAAFKCQARDGAISYTNHTIAGARCTRMNGTAGGGVGAKALVQPRVVRSDDPGAMRIRVYTFMHNGVRQYVSRRPEGISARVDVLEVYHIKGCYLCAAPRGFKVASLRLDTHSYRREIEAASGHYGVDRELIRAVIHAESAFRPNAISDKGAQGLMQLMPATSERFAVDNPFDAGQNIRGGVRYLAWLLKRFNGNQRLALAGYNAGEASVDQYNGVPPYAETQSYVTLVQSLTERYRDRR